MRRPEPPPLGPLDTQESIKGCQYTAIRFTQRLADAEIAPSTGSVGDSFDNALAENLWSTIKVELVYRHTWATREEADAALFRYIDGWYNPRRIQQRLDGLSPDEHEAAWYAQQHDLPDPVSSHTELTKPDRKHSGKPGEPHGLAAALCCFKRFIRLTT